LSNTEKGDLRIKDSVRKWNDPFILITLLIVSIISHFPFVIEGIGEPDSARIAAVVIDRITHGTYGPLAGYYFTDTIPLYIEYLTFFMRLTHNNFTYLPMIMNYSNAFFATMCVVPAYLIIKWIFNDSTIAFCSVIALIFNPSFFQASTYGTPHLIAFFFFLVSLYFFILWVEGNRRLKYLMLSLSCLSLLITMLIKTPLVLAGGIYPALLYIKKVKDKKKIVFSFFSLISVFILFLITRNQLIGSLNTDTASVGSLIGWFKYFFGSVSFGFFMRQIKPPILGLGVVTSVLGLISFFYFVKKRRVDVLLFVVSWSALSYFFWFFVLGNNTRHFMIGVLPVIVMIVIFLYDKAPKFTLLLTIALIFGNAVTTLPSPATNYTSGNLFKSNILHNDRVKLYHARAKEIVNINANKVAVMGRFHNPYVVYEILSSAPSYEAKLLTSVRSSFIRITTKNKEYVLCYIDKTDPENAIEKALKLYNLYDYTIVSATYDLQWLRQRGIKVMNTELLDDYYHDSFKDILSFL
jgi:hypothetical protein